MEYLWPDAEGFQKKGGDSDGFYTVRVSFRHGEDMIIFVPNYKEYSRRINLLTKSHGKPTYEQFYELLTPLANEKYCENKNYYLNHKDEFEKQTIPKSENEMEKEQ